MEVRLLLSCQSRGAADDSQQQAFGRDHDTVYGMKSVHRSEEHEIKVKLTGVCCQGCVDAVDDAVKSVAGVTSRCDMEKRAVALTARNDAAAQKALDAIAAAGPARS